MLAVITATCFATQSRDTPTSTRICRTTLNAALWLQSANVKDDGRDIVIRQYPFESVHARAGNFAPFQDDCPNLGVGVRRLPFRCVDLRAQRGPAFTAVSMAPGAVPRVETRSRNILRVPRDNLLTQPM